MRQPSRNILNPSKGVRIDQVQDTGDFGGHRSAGGLGRLGGQTWRSRRYARPGLWTGWQPSDQRGRAWPGGRGRAIAAGGGRALHLAPARQGPSPGTRGLALFGGRCSGYLSDLAIAVLF